MYARSYYPESEKMSVPENYDGNAFGHIDSKDGAPEERHSEKSSYEPVSFLSENPTLHEDRAEPVLKKHASEGGFGSIFKRLPFSNIFGGVDFFRDGFKSIGTEEILLIGVAIFLLLSKNGDKECAVMLLALLFIK